MGLLRKAGKIRARLSESGVDIGSKTSVDVLYDLIIKNGRLSFEEASKKLNVSQDDIENIAKVLERDNLVSIHYPVFGTPEIRKKDYVAKGNGSMNHKLLIVVGAVVVIVALFLFALREDTVPRQQAPELRKAEAAPLNDNGSKGSIVKAVTLGTAFSGSGQYKCDFEKAGVKAVYYIIDKKMRIETMVDNKLNTVVVVDGYTYTYLDSKDAWAKVKTPSSTTVPGSGKIPSGSGIEFNCYNANIEESQFTIDGAKII